MNDVDNHVLMKLKYENDFAMKVSKLKAMRKNLHIPQREVASNAGCSLRKVQLFETHKCLDAYLFFVYQELFNVHNHLKN